jgi:hypothetical protein
VVAIVIAVSPLNQQAIQHSPLKKRAKLPSPKKYYTKNSNLNILKKSKTAKKNPEKSKKGENVC